MSRGSGKKPVAHTLPSCFIIKLYAAPSVMSPNSELDCDVDTEAAVEGTSVRVGARVEDAVEGTSVARRAGLWECG